MRTLNYPEELLPKPLSIVSLALPVSRPLNDAETTALEKLFEFYIKAWGRGDLLKPTLTFDAARLKDIHDAYAESYEGGRINDVRGILLKIAGNRCPSCGGSAPRTLDHHLPRKHYSEFSVFSWNLVPMCERCNRKKGEYIGIDEETAQIHPYFDPLPNLRFIAVSAEVSAQKVNVNITVDNTSGIDSKLADRITNQFIRIGINEALAPEIEEMIGEYSNNINRNSQNDNDNADAVSAYLEKEAELFENTYGLSFWKAALLRALSKDNAYCSGGYRALLKTVRLRPPAALGPVAPVIA